MEDIIMKTLLFAVWQALSELCLCIGRKRQSHGRNTCRLTLSFVAICSWDVCRIPVSYPLQHCRIRRQVIGHLFHILWSIQSISKGQHAGESPPAVPSLLPWSVRLAIVDDHTQRMGNLLAVHFVEVFDADHRPLKGRKIGKPSPLTLSKQWLETH